MDSYQKFRSDFGINEDRFYQWGIDSTIFPDPDKVKLSWDNLKDRIFNNKTVYIRGYGRDVKGTQLYKDFYELVFENSNVEKDPTNNRWPQQNIETLTGLKRNRDIFNYQVSHIWGHTKNVFLFEAPWNICYTPKIIDPFTGHEASGVWPKQYKKLFLARAFDLYKPFIEEYNDIISSYDIACKLQIYTSQLEGTFIPQKLSQFKSDAMKELAVIK